MDLKKKFSFPRVRAGIRYLFSSLQFRREAAERAILDDKRSGKTENLMDNIDAIQSIDKDWNEWMSQRYRNKWTSLRDGKDLQEVLKFLAIYLDDVRIAKLGEIQKRPEKSLELGQQAEGISLAMMELAFLEKITEKPVMEVTMKDIH